MIENGISDDDILILALQAHQAETVEEYETIVEIAQLTVSETQYQAFLAELARLQAEGEANSSAQQFRLVQIEHIAVWTKDLERLKRFYEVYFGAQAGEKYVNPAKQFESYFLSFSFGPRLELMVRPDLPDTRHDAVAQFAGYNHLAFSVGSAAAVDALTARLQQDGYPVLDGPRQTGDGYYESVVLDPDGNRLEITV
jgi:lactoylglutathione lyase